MLRLNAAKKLHAEVCSLLLASLANLQKSLNEFLELMSSTITTNRNGDRKSLEMEGNYKDSVLTLSEKRRRFFDRVEMKKVREMLINILKPFIFLHR